MLPIIKTALVSALCIVSLDINIMGASGDSLLPFPFILILFLIKLVQTAIIIIVSILLSDKAEPSLLKVAVSAKLSEFSEIDSITHSSLLQAFASSVSGSLATAAVLGGLGVGDSQATPLAATLTWIMKDGAGMIGRIVFAAYCGTSLDFDCKVIESCISLSTISSIQHLIFMFIPIEG